MLPRSVTLGVLEAEIHAARAWGARRAVSIEWLPEDLELKVVLRQRSTDDSFFLVGEFEDYKLIAPAWTFRNSEWSDAGQLRHFPATSSIPGVSGSLFHPSGIICAPFNRLAFSDCGGPHGDWGGAPNWMSVKDRVMAHTVGDMLAAIARDLAYSNGRMGK